MELYVRFRGRHPQDMRHIDYPVIVQNAGHRFRGTYKSITLLIN